MIDAAAPSRETLEAENTRLRALAIKPVSLRDLLNLTMAEEDVLRELMASYPHPSLGADIYFALTGRTYGATNPIEVLVSRVRRKIALHGFDIETRRGSGWVLSRSAAEHLLRMVGAKAP